MGKIVLLDELTINKIAAGEVIERPASVIKEMIENSIDAGATNITVEIRNGGISYIRITDNGRGIEKDDLEIAFERHATSKIRNADDLNVVKSMGFRGEALASIAAISNVELCSKTENDDIGHKIVVEAGKVLEQDEVGCAQGTTITVKNLFFNTPVRYKFLKKDYTESGYIEDAISRLAIVNTNVAFKLINTGKTVIQTNGDGNINNVIFSIYGKDTAKALLPVEYNYDGIDIKGVVGKPEIARSNRGNQLFFVNKRYVKDKVLSGATEKAFKGLLPIGKYGFVVLNIDIDPSTVDVNVHPAKLEVRFQDESKIFKAVHNALKDTLLKAELIENVEEKANYNYTEGKGLDTYLGKPAFLNTFRKIAEPQPETPVIPITPAAPTLTIEDIVAQKIEREEQEKRAQEEAKKKEEAKEIMNDIIVQTDNIIESLYLSKNGKNAVSEETIKIDMTQRIETIPEQVIKTEEANDVVEKSDNIPSEETITQMTQNIQTQFAKPSTGDIITQTITNNIKEEKTTTSFEDMYTKIFGKIKKQQDEENSEENNTISAKDIMMGDIRDNLSLYEKEDEYNAQINKQLNYKLIGIAFKTYIIIEIDEELYIIDQHAAHERIMYEKVKTNYYSDTQKDSQLLLLPDVITLSHKEMDIARDNMDKFEKAGFQLEEFGDNTIKLTGAPTMCLELNTRDLFLETLDEINTVARTAKQEIEERFLATIACKAAVKANMALTTQEVDSLLQQLLSLPNPFTCPHGRPTAIKMTQTDIEKKFARRK